jgi:hypothetical protein
MGCLSWPFKALAVVVLALVVVGAIVYRTELREMGSGLFRPPPPQSVGRPGTRALGVAKDKVATLAAAQEDSVVLTATEMASLIGDGLDPSFRGHLDSLQVELLEGRIAVRGRLRTSALPSGTLGPLALIVQEWEPFSATGPIRVVAPMEAEWTIEQLSLREIPFPREMVQWLVSTVLGGNAESGFPVQIPEGIGAAAVHPHGVVLYRNGP